MNNKVATIKVNEQQQSIDIYLEDNLFCTNVFFTANAITYHKKLAELINYGYELKFV